MQEDPLYALESSLYALRKSFFLILAVSCVAALVSYGVARNIPGTYEVHFSYMVSMEQKDVAPGFRYDGYYALSATDLFSATLASVASSPETIVAAHQQAGVQLPTQDAIRLARIVRAEKAAPQLVRITVSGASKQAVELLASGLRSVMEKEIDAYNTRGLSSIIFHGIATDSWTGISKVAPIPIAASIFMLVFLGGNMAVLMYQAFHRGSS